MGKFRPGKPWRRFALATDKVHPAGHGAIPWDTAVGDPDATALAPASQWVCDKPGLYLLNYGVARPIVGTTGAVFTTLRVNNVQRAGANSPSTTGSVQLSASAVEQLLLNDVVTVFASLHPITPTAFNRQLTYLSVVRIGPVRWT